MNWTLPVAGGLYDQDPMLLDYWQEIISAKAEHDKAERDAQNRKSRGGGGMLGAKAPRPRAR